MKILYKLLSGFLLVALLSGAVAYFGMNTIDSIDKAYSIVEDGTIPARDSIEEIRFFGMLIISHTEQSIGKPENKLSYKEQIRNISEIENFDKSIRRYDELVNKYFPEEVGYARNINDTGQKIKLIGDELINLKMQDATEEEIRRKFEEFEGAKIEFLDAIDIALENENKEFAGRSRELASTIGESKNTLLMVSLLALIMAMVIGSYVSKSISDPMFKLKSAADEIGRGNLNARVDIRPGDEIGTFSCTFNKMVYDLSEEISRHKQTVGFLKQKNEFVKTVLESLSYPFYVINANDYSIALANSAACKEGSAEGSKCYALIHRSDEPCGTQGHKCPLEEVKKTGKPVVVEHVHYDKDGNVRNMEVRCYPIFDRNGNVVQVIEYSMDITERKRNEEIRIENERLALANKAKSEFLTIMSHELRTPLNAILGFSELIKNKNAGVLNEKQIRYADNIHSSGKHLLSLIDDILDITRIESGKTELILANMSVAKVIDDSVEIIREQAAKQNIEIKKQIGADIEFIETDKNKVRQVLNNLLGNAVKFSKSGSGTITITAEKDKDMVKFSVSDTGIGIKEEDMGRLFQSFEQLDVGIARKYEGTGLGLAVSKKLVELLGGRITAESRYGKGSRFTFYLPVQMKNKGK